MRLEHTALYVRDLEGARVFFQGFFGAAASPLYHNRATGFRSYFLSFGEGARLELMNRPGLPEGDPQPRLGYAHIALGAGSREGVDALTRKLAEAGYRVLSGPRVTGDGYYESCVEGFEGNLVEITA